MGQGGCLVDTPSGSKNFTSKESTEAGPARVTRLRAWFRMGRPVNQHVQLRVLNILFFLVAVNWTAGTLAVRFRYPSLWGTSDVFAEYAYPLPLSWALAHLVTMLPLAYATWRSWDWEAAQLRRFRLGLLIGLIGSAAIDVLYGGGRWHRIPFVLFAVVDFGWALALSLLLTARTRRVAISAVALGGILMVAWPSVSAYLQERERTEAFESIASKDGRVRARGRARGVDAMEYSVEVAIPPGDVLTRSMCIDVLRVYEDMLAFHERADPEPVVRIVRPNDDAPFARAAYSARGEWRCVSVESTGPTS